VTVSKSLLEEMRALLGDRVSQSQAVRDQHGAGEGLRESMPPALVAFPQSTQEVAAIVQLCMAHRTPIIPFGAGTSLEGQVQAPEGGVSIDVSRMDAILAINAEDFDCHIQAGVRREALNLHLRDLGLFFPLDPGANATLGGMAATRASGTNAVRYGTMRDVTLGLTVVTPTGKVIRTGGRARKSSTGYDLTRLYVGSEGTLGVITELRLRLFAAPEAITAAIVQFPDLGDAVGAVVTMMQQGLGLARIELLDRVQMGACIKHSDLKGMAAQDTLFLEIHGSPRAVAEQVELARDVCMDAGGAAFVAAASPEERTQLWKARHNAYWAARALRPGFESFATDACVPISALPACIAQCQASAAQSGLIAPIVGHVGDGNFHMLILFDPADPGARDRADALANEVARVALRHGGTISGEHGIGLHKRALMGEEHDEGALGVMGAIKRALDPLNIMNPGKLLPDPR
jgi:D-lactate dehydrogenase (cytochrome)